MAIWQLFCALKGVNLVFKSYEQFDAGIKGVRGGQGEWKYSNFSGGITDALGSMALFCFAFNLVDWANMFKGKPSKKEQAN